jgi:hypothetical protein
LEDPSGPLKLSTSQPAEASMIVTKEAMIRSMEIPERIGKMTRRLFSRSTLKLSKAMFQPFDNLEKKFIRSVLVAVNVQTDLLINNHLLN